VGIFLFTVILSISGGAMADRSSALFPFVLPWDDSSHTATDLSGWLHRPAGRFGHIYVGEDGHLYAGGKRIRFFGVNLCFGACFPGKEDAGRIAARMAKFGINIVRFHHMDMFQFPDGIRMRGVPHTRELDPEALDRLDYFVYKLKEKGIYVNLNLLVSRPFNSADGLPGEIEDLPWKERHTVGFFYRLILELQKEYAKKLLAHRNPYTGTTYAEEPAVAFVEVNNENGLVHSWLGGHLDGLPEVFSKELRRRWNLWLRERYGTTEALRRAWGVREEPSGPELLENADFQAGLEGWVLERHCGAEATATLSDDVPEALRGVRSVRITVKKLGEEGWHVQFNRPGLEVEADRPYTLSFWAKADRPCRINLALKQAHEPWRDLGPRMEVKLRPEWRKFKFSFVLERGDGNARLDFSGLGRQEASYWLAGISLRQGGTVGLRKDERLEDGSVEIFPLSRFGERTSKAQGDWIRFLWETEEDYWREMYTYLKEEVGVKALVVGTIVGCSTPNLMAKFDCIDSHAYWQHPKFPGRPWDPEDWIVPNISMVNERGGTIGGLAVRRVSGKPFTVTEYNHPAPNTYGAEGFPLLAAYASFQDWDAIYAFAYSHRRDDWDRRCIRGFFDVDQHPVKMVTLVPSAAMFLRGDVRPARKCAVVSLDPEREVDLLRKAHAWELVDARHLGLPPEAALLHRVASATGGEVPKDALGPGNLESPGDRFVSDTGELVWDLSDPERGVVTINSVRSKAVIGYGGGKKFDLGGVIIEPRETLQGGWSVLTLTVVDGESFSNFTRLLITATGYVQNTDMRWREVPGYPPRSSCGRDWGRAPSLVEGVQAVVTLPVPAEEVEAWALDGRGGRRERLPVEEGEGGRAVVRLEPEWRTLWYEVKTK